MKPIKSQLRTGIRVEGEHKNLLPFIKRYRRKYGRYPSQRAIATVIAKKHLTESSVYYTKLRRARL